MAVIGAFSLAAGQSLVPPAIPTPNGDTAFVGSITVRFDDLPLRNGNVYYTLDGTDPTNKSKKYEDNLDFSRTTTLKSIRYLSGNRSAVHTARFIRARMPQPVARYGGRTEFTGTVRCTLDLPAGPARRNDQADIYYTTRPGGRPDTLYNRSQALVISRALTVTAWAVHPDYDTSLPISIPFKLLQPVERPTLSPLTNSKFSTPTLRVEFSSNTQGAYYLYTTKPGGTPDTLASSVTLEGKYLNQEFTVRVVAAKNGMANSPVVEGKYTYVPKAARPTVTPEATVFTDTQRVVLRTATDSADIFYTLNGVNPTLASTKYVRGSPILIDTAYQLRAFAYKKDQPFSDFLSVNYAYKLTKPTPNVGGGDFHGTLSVKLTAANPKAAIFYTLEGRPGAPIQVRLQPGETITLGADTTHLWAVAVLGDVKSDTARHTYYKKNQVRVTAQPTASPEGKEFLGRISVALFKPSPDATIHYTLDGTDPTRASPIYSEPLTLDRTTVLKAFAVSGNLEPSSILRQTYVLIPSTPVAEPGPDSTYANRVEVRLSTTTPGATIYYKLGEWKWSKEELHLANEYDKKPGFRLVLTQTTPLTAVAVTGSDSTLKLSEPLSVHYTIFQTADSDTLRPGANRSLFGPFVLWNRGDAPVTAKVTTFDGQALRGFKDPSHLVQVGFPGTAPPKLVFQKPGLATHGVYRLGGDGVPVLLGRTDSVALPGAGTYFAAIDTLPPAVAVLAATPAAKGTSVRLLVTDNAAPVACTVIGSGLAAPTGLAVQADGLATFTLSNPPGPLKTLSFQATATDGLNAAHFPAQGGRYAVEQAVAKLATPTRWNTGQSPGDPWDMVGFPVGPASTLTWGQIREENRDGSLTAMVYRQDEYAPLVDADTIEAGMSFWLGSQGPTRSLVLPRFQSGSSDADGLYRLTLRPGWNLVTNPSLETLYWPVVTSQPDYRQSRVRRLLTWKRSPEGPNDWAEADSMEAWKGYWVYLAVVQGSPARDTVIALSQTRPVPEAPLAKTAAPGGIDIRLDFGRSLPIRLGAQTYGHDAVAVEDEPVLPDWRKTRRAWSDRERSRLMTDVIRLRPGEVMRWKVVLEGNPAPGRDSLVRVVGSVLPPGCEAWAWSPSRNLKVRLEAATSYSMPGAGPDTLVVLAGPAAKLAGLPELARAVDGVTAFASGIRQGRQARLFLALPSDALVRAELYTPAGRRVASLHSGKLGSGHHDLPLPAGAPGIVLVRIRAQGPGWSADRVHKLAR